MKTSTLIAHMITGVQYLMSPDLKVIQEISTDGIEFTSFNDIPGIEFEYDDFEERWEIEVHNPYVHLID